MGTKSHRSSGSQFNPKGVTQGVTLVCHHTGDPIDCIEDVNGVRRLAVDAQVSATIGEVNVDLNGVDPNGDSVHLVDATTGNKMKVNADGSLDVNIESDAADGDNIAISDGTNTVVVNPNGSLNVNVDQINIDGVYNGTTNPKPDNIGIVGSTRSTSPVDSNQTNRITSVTDNDVHALDVALHNSDGKAIDNNNPLPVINADPDIVPTHFESAVATAGSPDTLSLTNKIQLAFIFNPHRGANQNDPSDVLYVTIDGGTKKTTIPRGSSRYFAGVFNTFKVDTNNNGTNYEVILWEIP
jgi:hypothetical protein